MKYYYFLPHYSIFSHIPPTKVDPNVDITFFLTLTKLLSLTGLIDSFHADRNNHLLNVTFAVLVYSGFRALPPLASGQHPLFLVKIIHSWPKLAPGLNKFAGSVFFINDIWLNSASTYCVIFVDIYEVWSTEVMPNLAAFDWNTIWLFGQCRQFYNDGDKLRHISSTLNIPWHHYLALKYLKDLFKIGKLR